MNGIRIYDVNRTTGPRHRDRHFKTRAGATQGKGRATQASTVGKLHHRVVSRNSRCKTRRYSVRVIRLTGIIRSNQDRVCGSIRGNTHRPARRVCHRFGRNRDLTLMNGIRVHYHDRTTRPRDRDLNLKTRADTTQGEG